MKKYSFLFLSFLTSVFLLVSCGPITKKIAQKTISGDYQGTISFAFKASMLKIGLQDYTDKQKCRLTVFPTSDSPSLVYVILKQEGGFYPPVNINIAGIQLRPNGASFNIPPQQIKDSNSNYYAEGVPMFVDTDGNKVDGSVDDQSNLAFSFTGNMPIPIKGRIVEIPCVVTCNMKKL